MNLMWFLPRIVFDFLIFYFLYVSLVCFLIYIYQGWQSWIQNDRWKILNSVFGLMVMSVFAENSEWIWVLLQMQNFCFPDLGKEKLCSILVFGNVCFNIVVRINHDNVVSRGGCWTYSHHCHSADKNPSKRWNREFRGFRICIGWISTTGFCAVSYTHLTLPTIYSV